MQPKPFQSSRQVGLVASFAHAWNGLVHTVAHQRNMRVHVTAALLVSLVGSGIELGLAEKVTLVFCVLLVFFAEILNSALEHLVDLATAEQHHDARIAKDAAAAGVLVLSIGTVVIFAAIIVANLEVIRASGPQIARQVVIGLPLTSCGVVLMTGGQRAPWIDVTAALVGVGLWVGVALATASTVFAAMTLGLLTVAGAAGLQRRRELAEASARRLAASS